MTFGIATYSWSVNLKKILYKWNYSKCINISAVPMFFWNKELHAIKKLTIIFIGAIFLHKIKMHSILITTNTVRTFKN